LCFTYTDYTTTFKMSSYQVIDMPDMFPCIQFAGTYKCFVPSVIDAIQATEIVIDGIAGVTRHQHCTRVYPSGRFCCGECGLWKVLDTESRAWAIRSSEGDCPLVAPKLVCEECSDMDAFSEGCRFAVLAHEDFYVTMRHDFMKVYARMLSNKWRVAAKLRKERREFALKSALIFKTQFESRSEGWIHAWETFMVHT